MFVLTDLTKSGFQQIRNDRKLIAAKIKHYQALMDEFDAVIPFLEAIYEPNINIDFKENIPEWNTEGTSAPKEMILITENRRELQSLMTNYVGIVRNNTRLKRALDRLRIIYGETEALYERTIVSPALCELRNMINLSYLVVKAAMARNENRGLHYNSDLVDSNPKK